MNKKISITPSRNDIVRKSDALVKARYSLSELALKFVTAVITNIKRSDDVDKEYIFRVKDFAEMVGVGYGEFYNEMKDAVDELLKKPLHIKTDRGWIKANWIADAEYVEGEGYISFTISKKLRPYLFLLQEKFLQYRIENILKLKSGYVIRIFEILKDWYNGNTRYSKSKKVEKIVKVDWIRETLEIPRGYRYNDIKRIIEKAKKQLAEKTDIKFDYEEIKTGRKVTHIKFIIEENPKNIENEDDPKKYYFLQSKSRFIAYLRKNYKNKTFRTIDYGEFVAKYKIGDDGLVHMSDGYSTEKLRTENIDKFFENTYREALENNDYAEMLASRVEIG